MKKAFTLVELMIVVVVIVTLMAITFRLAGMGGEMAARNSTVQRLQRVENALSGYFAAFGSYPPVALHGKRNVYARVDQTSGEQTNGEESSLVWASVEAACRAQPFGAAFPFSSDMTRYVDTVSRIVSERANSGEKVWRRYTALQWKLGGGFSSLNNPNQVNGWKTKTSWEEVKIFKFGVMSYLMPRYLFMTSGLKGEDLDDCAQWNANNRLSAHPNTGTSFGGWKDELQDARLVRRIPSQSVCARWMPNFEGSLDCSSSVARQIQRNFGVNIWTGNESLNAEEPEKIDVHINQNRTVLDSITFVDGWGNEFYYYSAPPYQSYRVWSAGPNGKTFPKWIPLDTVANSADRVTASNWAADDVEHMDN